MVTAHKAVGERSGTVVSIFSDSTSLGSLTNAERFQMLSPELTPRYNGRFDVKTICLDEIVRESGFARISLLKMDCEVWLFSFVC